jgi:hypothetical protein
MSQNQTQIKKGFTLLEIYNLGNRPLKIDAENGRVTTKIGKNIINYWERITNNQYINVGSKIIQY